MFSVLSAILQAVTLAGDPVLLGNEHVLRGRVTEFSIPRRPMKALRCTTVIPSLSYGSTNALIPPR